MPDKWEQNAVSVDKWEQQATPDFSYDPTGKQGRYKMRLEQDKDFTPVPYSRVMEAAGAGFKIDPKDRERFAHDRKGEVLGQLRQQHSKPTFWGATKDYFWNAPEAGTISDEDVIKAMGPLPEALSQKPGVMSRMWGGVESGVQKVTEPTSYFGAPTGVDPAFAEMSLNIIKRTARNLFGIADMPVQAFDALADSFSNDPQKARDGAHRFFSMINPTDQVVARWKELKTDWQRDPKLAASNVAGDLLPIWLLHKTVAGEWTPSKLGRRVTKGLRPVNVESRGIPGVDQVVVPLGVGEAHPESFWGRPYNLLKRGGVKPERFEELHGKTVEATKRGIVGIAQEAAGITDLPKEPGEAMKGAATMNRLEAQSRYAALDTRMANMPAGQTIKLSQITEQALRRAKRIGLDFTDDPEITKTVYRDKSSGQIKSNLTTAEIRKGLKAGTLSKEVLIESQPFKVFQKLRSELLDIQRASDDPLKRRQIGNEVKAMNDQMKAEMEKADPESFRIWKEADRFWARSYAQDTIGDEIRKSTKGTPEEHQAEGLTKVPQRLQTSSLVARMNDLGDDGILERGFDKDEAHNLRAFVNLLERSEETPIGRERGRHLSEHAALSSALHGSVGPVIGGVLGATIGGWHGMGLGAALGLIAQRFSEGVLVKIMTTTEGVEAAEAVEAAKTPAAKQVAMNRLSKLAEQVAAQAPATATAAQAEQSSRLRLQQLKQQAVKNRPPGSTTSLTPAASTPNTLQSNNRNSKDNNASFASAISSVEGYGPANAIPTRANNPGNLELGDVGYGTMKAANGQQVTIFATPQDGWNALNKQLNKIFSGGSKKYSPKLTLQEFGSIYSGGDLNYGAKIAAALGVKPTTTLGQLGAIRQQAAQAASPAPASAAAWRPATSKPTPKQLLADARRRQAVIQQQVAAGVY